MQNVRQAAAERPGYEVAPMEWAWVWMLKLTTKHGAIPVVVIERVVLGPVVVVLADDAVVVGLVVEVSGPDVVLVADTGDVHILPVSMYIVTPAVP